MVSYERENSHLGLASRDDRVTGDDLRHHTASGLDTKRESVDVDENDVAEGLVTGEDTTLDGSTVRDGLIGVNALRRLLAEVLLQELLDLRDTGRTTDKDNLRHGCKQTIEHEHLWDAPHRCPPS